MDYNLVEASAQASTRLEAHFLGASPAEWTAAFVAAVVVAIIWEVGTAATRRVTKRLPFIILRLARLGMPRDDWQIKYVGEWMPELHACLADPDLGAVRRFLNAMGFAIPLAFGGAYRTAKALRRPTLASIKGQRSPHAQRWRARMTATLAMAGTQVVYNWRVLLDGPEWLMTVAWVGMGASLITLGRYYVLQWRASPKRKK